MKILCILSPGFYRTHEYKGLPFIHLFGLFLIFLNPLISISNSSTLPMQFKSVRGDQNERAENVRYLQSIEQTAEQHLLSRQMSLLTFIEHFSQSALPADYTLNGVIDHHDLFYYAAQWRSLPSSIPTIDELNWTIESGDWQFEDWISGSSLTESRLVSAQTVPNSFQASLSINMRDGSSAGFMLWSDSSGLTGFVIRYDALLHALLLSRVGPRLEEERLDTYPLNNFTESIIRLTVETTPITIRAFLQGQNLDPVLETTNITPMGSHIGWYIYDAEAQFQLHTLTSSSAVDPVYYLPDEGEYQHIYDQSIGESEPWYINDHCFIQDQSGTWHLFGISNTASPIEPLHEDQFIHATATELTQSPWQKHPFALQTNTTVGESQLWAPHIFFKDGIYHMFYCAGSQFSSLEYRMHLATSTDLFHWTRHDANPLFTDFYDARDPMILQYGDQYIMYYTANSERNNGNYIVAYRTSPDLINWSPRKTAFTHSSSGNSGGPTESPFVVPYDGQFYLFIGPEYLNTSSDENYRRTAIYRSSNPFHWDRDDRITSVRSHAAEIIYDMKNNWYVSHCGWFYDGVYVAPLEWKREPQIQLFLNLGESLNYVTGHFYAMVSDWRSTGGLDLVADYGSYFDLELPVSQHSSSILLEFEEEGETLLRINTETGYETLLDEGNTGPASAQIHQIFLETYHVRNNTIELRFQDSDPADGWGPNVNWIRLTY